MVTTMNKSNFHMIKEEIWQLDEDISTPVFEMTLPKILEYILSVPGNVFGMTPCLLVGPFWIMIALNTKNTSLSPSLLILTVAMTIGYLYAWAAYLKGNEQMLKQFLTSTKLYMIAPAFTTPLLCYYTSATTSLNNNNNSDSTDNLRLRSLALYPTVIWMVSVSLTLILKNIALRSRPCSKFHNLHERKHAQIIPNFLAKVAGRSSFPSADATGVIGFALSLSILYPMAASILVVTVCFGRLYFLAHHLLDTIVGCAVGCTVYLSLAALGMDMETTRWWHVIAAQAFFVGVVASSKHYGYR